MKTINIAKVIEDKYPPIMSWPGWIRRLVIRIFEKVLHLREVNNFLESHADVYGMPFIDGVFDMINFSFSLSHADTKKIPSEGRVICVSNHPIGSLDGLALLRAVSQIRPDVKIIANSVLLNIENLHEYFLPFTLDTPSAQKKNIQEIGAALEREEAVIIFPAAEVSRLVGFKVMDRRWHKGPIYFSKKFNVPILPMFVQAKNSCFFYAFSLVFMALSQVLLSHEMFNKKNKTIRIKVGDPIPAKAFSQGTINDKIQIKLLKRHVYLVGRGKEGIYQTEKNIIHPIEKVLLKKELNDAKLLGKTRDGKHLLITTLQESPNVLKEIARLREVTFRKVGEGTGKVLDMDKYDKYYKHIVVWDDDALEIVGSYRIGFGKEIMDKYGENGFYTTELFENEPDFVKEVMPIGAELGRSFVQKKYWNTQALHVLWLGIGAFLADNPDIKYLFGPVTISNNYPDAAKKLMVYYFNKWYGPQKYKAKGTEEFVLTKSDIDRYDEVFTGETYREDFRTLKNLLKPFGFSVPILFKHYTELCQGDGAQFLCFNIDVDFESCVDGYLLIEVDKIRQDKKDRYINVFKPKEETTEENS